MRAIVKGFLWLATSCLLWASIQSADPPQPGIKIRLTRSGLDYADRIGATLLNFAIRGVQIPPIDVDINGGPGHGKASASNIRIVDFRPPRFAYALHPPQSIEWITGQGAITVSGDWTAWYTVLVRVWLSGSFAATAGDIQLSAVIRAIDDTDGKPAVKLISCRAKLGYLDLQITGGFVQWIINLFSPSIAASIKSALESQVCQQAQTVLVAIANQKLKSLPTSVPLGRGFLLDYSLEADPVVADRYVEGWVNGSITWIDGSSVPVQCPGLPDVPGDLDRMVYIWASDYVLNTLFYR